MTANAVPLSARLKGVVDALPLRPGLRVLEIGGAPGAAAREVALDPGVPRFDLAFACRVGALDGRHPALYEAALRGIGRALRSRGALYVDTGHPLHRIEL